MAQRVLTASRVNILSGFLMVGLLIGVVVRVLNAQARKRAHLFPRTPTRLQKTTPLGNLLDSDRRSFATISQRYQGRD